MLRFAHISSPFNASLVITIQILRYICTHTLVLSIEDSTAEAVIQRMIEAKWSFIREDPEGIPISSVTKRHFQLQIQTLQNAPRDPSKLEQIIKAKERENEKARHIEDTQRLVTEIEMLKFVLCLVNRNNRNITSGFNNNNNK